MKPIVIFILALLSIGCQTHYSTQSQIDSTATVTDTTTHQSSTNSPVTAPTAPSEANDHEIINMPTIQLDSIKFDEDFHPIAQVTINNTTGKEIDNVQLRFLFTDHNDTDGRLDAVSANDYSVLVNMPLKISPPDSRTVYIRVPEPRMKRYDIPKVYLVKVRLYDGSIVADDRWN